MIIEVAISCVWFQRRLTWMLSSIFQQKDPPQLLLNVAYPPLNGKPTTEAVLDFFDEQPFCWWKPAETIDHKQIEVERRQPAIKRTCLPMEEMKLRGEVRNRQVKESTADWLLLADCDMIYSPNFFCELAKQLDGPLKDEKRCMSASRISLDKPFCKNLFTTDGEPYPRLVPEVADIVSKWPVNQGDGKGIGKDGVSRNMGAGYFQLINLKALRELHGGWYNPPGSRKDPDWGYKSDKIFRNMTGVKKIALPPQWHLNHERDNEAGEHLEIQR